MVKIYCPQCKEYKDPSQWIGQHLKCLKCGSYCTPVITDDQSTDSKGAQESINDHLNPEPPIIFVRE